MANSVLTRNSTLPSSAEKADFYNLVDTATISAMNIVNADIDSAAAIADTKLATISTAGKVSGTALTSLGSIPAGAGTIPAANLPSTAVIPTGLIAMWSGSVATIPTGWLLCNGASGTPDLRDTFIVGAKQDDSGVAKTNITGSLTQTGGAATADLTHTHSVPRDGWGNSGPGVTDGRLSVRSDGGGGSVYAALNDNTTGEALASAACLPTYYALCFIMKS